MQLFYLDINGVTIKCPDAQVGDTGVVNGFTYTKRDRDGLDVLVAGAQAELVTTCTSGVDDMSSVFDVRAFWYCDILTSLPI